MTLGAELAAGLRALELCVEAKTQEKLLGYLALIAKWNRVYNLTAIREPERMLSYHLLDSLAVVPRVTGTCIVDVGSGAGLPGIPIALARPECRVTLVESNHKKSAFLRQAAIELELSNVEVRDIRVEAVEPRAAYDFVISRAFSDLPEFLTLAGPLCRENGTLAAMKGVYPYEELAQLPASYRLETVVPLVIPGLDAERHLVLIRKA